MQRILLSIFAIGLLGCGSAPPPDPAPVPEPPPLLPDGTPVGEDAIEPEPVPATPAEPAAEGPNPEPAAAAPPEAAAEEPADAGGRIPGANLTVGSMSVNDMTVNELECRLDSMGFLAAMQLVGSIAAQKKAMDKCAPKGDAPLVKWTFTGGKAKQVAVEGAASIKIEKCVAMAAGKMESAMVGECAAYFLVGDTAGATAAYDKAEGGK
jgi:hypothetical protein